MINAFLVAAIVMRGEKLKLGSLLAESQPELVKVAMRRELVVN